MSSSAPRKFEWLVVVPDFPGAQAKRVEVRGAHLAALKPAVEAGLFKMGGAVLQEVPPDNELSSLKFAGSTLIMVAESRQEVIDQLNKDVYASSGVWDVEKVQIWPMLAAFRNP